MINDCWNKEGTCDIMEKILHCCIRLEEWDGGLGKEMLTKLLDYTKEMCRFRSIRDV